MGDITVNSWQVYDLAHYETFAMDYMADAELTASLLIPLDNAHRNNGAFRITIHGGETETVPILVEDIFPCPPDSIKNLYINVPCSPSSLSFPANCTAGLWQDVESMIRKVNKRYDRSRYCSTVVANTTPHTVRTLYRFRYRYQYRLRLFSRKLPHTVRTLYRFRYRYQYSLSLFLTKVPLHHPLYFHSTHHDI
jgi:hypothetical protein